MSRFLFPRRDTCSRKHRPTEGGIAPRCGGTPVCVVTRFVLFAPLRSVAPPIRRFVRGHRATRPCIRPLEASPGGAGAAPIAGSTPLQSRIQHSTNRGFSATQTAVLDSTQHRPQAFPWLPHLQHATPAGGDRLERTAPSKAPRACFQQTIEPASIEPASSRQSSLVSLRLLPADERRHEPDCSSERLHRDSLSPVRLLEATPASPNQNIFQWLPPVHKQLRAPRAPAVRRRRDGVAITAANGRARRALCPVPGSY